ncbi:selenium metabolism membrane protein YedE/FdhT [Saccharomonospora viridis]|uniref:selenium metabolism membrane protein YedE/FdhT n=1 Tax=Saccharomonospora viridis TaxID=1852 RepID=UPI0023F1896E|nr:selenium metabolism membrane protein YedE/FdhT [Saccharomonospora viridis]
MGRLYRRLFGRFWNPYLAVLGAGVLSACYFAVTAAQWAVTGEFTRFGGHLLGVVGVDVSGWDYFQLIGWEGTPLDRTGGWVVVGMLAGALVAALLGNDFKFRVPRKRRLFQGLLGGAIAGFGARLALGCNLAAFFTGIPQFSFHAWLFMVALAVGTVAGVKVIRLRFWRGPPKLSAVERLAPLSASAANVPSSGLVASRSAQPFVGVGVALVVAGVAVFLAYAGEWLLSAAALFGVGFGVLIQRGQICFTSAFRDLWVSGRATMSKALAVGLLVATVLTFVVIQSGTPAIIEPSSPGTVVGGLLFGFGIVLAGGCETGMMYRAMEGQVHFVAVFVGNVVGATVLAYGWDHWGIYSALTEGWPEVDLVAAWGAGGALLATVTLVAGWLVFSRWWERRYRYGTGLGSGRQRRPVSESVS